MCSPCSTIYLIGPHRERLGQIARIAEKDGHETASFSDPGSFFVAGKIRHADCVVLDMTPLDGFAEPFALLAAILEAEQTAPVIGFSAESNVRNAVRAMKLGAFDYLPFPCTTLELRTSLAEALESVRRHRLEASRHLGLAARYEQLTAREKQVFALTVSGLANKEIAETLGLALQTVKIHRGRVFSKMQTTSALELFRFAQALGHVPNSVPALPEEEKTARPLRA